MCYLNPSDLESKEQPVLSNVPPAAQGSCRWECQPGFLPLLGWAASFDGKALRQLSQAVAAGAVWFCVCRDGKQGSLNSSFVTGILFQHFGDFFSSFFFVSRVYRVQQNSEQLCVQ